MATLMKRLGSVSCSRLSPINSSFAAKPRSFHASSRLCSDALAVHYDTVDNTDRTPFDFTEENMTIAKKIIAKYPPGYQRSAAIPLLDLAQRQCGGWLPLAAMQKIAKVLGTSDMAIYETASFYSMFNRTKVGTHFVQVCTTTPCMLRGSTEIMNACKKKLGIENGETTKDGKFTLIEVECLGACVNAPMMQIGDHYYEDLTPETTEKVLQTFAEGGTPKMGPQNHRKAAEGPQGKTTLLEEPFGPYCRDLDQILAERQAQQQQQQQQKK